MSYLVHYPLPMFVFNIKIQYNVVLYSKIFCWQYTQPPSAAAVRLGLLQLQGMSQKNFPACPDGQKKPKLKWQEGCLKEKKAKQLYYMRMNQLHQSLSQATHLCFNITEKGHMIVPDWYNRILDYTRKYCKNSAFFLQLK